MSSSRLRRTSTRIGTSSPRRRISAISEAARPSRPPLPQSTTMQPMAASVRIASSASSLRRARTTWKPSCSTLVTISCSRWPSSSLPSKAGAQTRNLNRRWYSRGESPAGGGAFAAQPYRLQRRLSNGPAWQFSDSPPAGNNTPRPQEFGGTDRFPAPYASKPVHEEGPGSHRGPRIAPAGWPTTACQSAAENPAVVIQVTAPAGFGQ